MSKLSFFSPTQGKLSFDQVVNEITSFISKNPHQVYRLIVGTDSEGKKNPSFVSAIVIYCQGKGGRYFWQKINFKKTFHTLREKIYQETMLSLKLATKLRKALEKKLKKNYKDLEIHTDIGQVGETKDMIKEIVAMIKGNGFQPKIKPEAFGATNVADRCLK